MKGHPLLGGLPSSPSGTGAPNVPPNMANLVFHPQHLLATGKQIIIPKLLLSFLFFSLFPFLTLFFFLLYILLCCHFSVNRYLPAIFLNAPSQLYKRVCPSVHYAFSRTRARRILCRVSGLVSSCSEHFFPALLPFPVFIQDLLVFSHRTLRQHS